MPTADLHTHTLYSDGTETPQQLIALAIAAGLSALAITDHDTMEGYEVAARSGPTQGLELIPGLEMSASFEGREVHMLGFFLNPADAALQQFLSSQRQRRIERIHEMVARLQALGVSVTPEDVFAAAGKGAVGRPHVAQALVNRGYVSTLKEAFERYIGANGPAYIPGSPVLPQAAMRTIRQAGGIPVLAHPVYLKDDALIDQWAQEGLAGLEVYHSSHTPEVIRRYEQIAERLQLLKTGGTDYHGTAKEGVAIGTATVPYALVEAMKQWKHAHPVAS